MNIKLLKQVRDTIKTCGNFNMHDFPSHPTDITCQRLNSDLTEKLTELIPYTEEMSQDDDKLVEGVWK